MTPQEVLDKAADLIEERGWAQREYEDRSGARCINGAVAFILGGESVPYKLLGTAEYGAATELVASRVKQGAIDFNDAPDRTVDEVLRALRGQGEFADSSR